MGSHWDYYMDLMQGDRAAAALHLRTCDEYNAVIDMAAEFYLDTIRIVFREFRRRAATGASAAGRCGPRTSAASSC